MELYNIKNMWYSEEDWYEMKHIEKDRGEIRNLIENIPNPNPFDDSKVVRISKDIIELLKGDDELMDEFIKRFNPILRRKKLNKLKNK